MDNEIWENSEFLTAWDGEDNLEKNIRYKLLIVPRGVIDANSEEEDAHLLIGIDNCGVRRIDILMDLAYGRRLGIDDPKILELAVKNAPEEATEIIKQYIED